MKFKMRALWILIIIGFQLQAQPESAWSTIFNGENLDGWLTVGDQGKFSVEDGCIKMRMSASSKRHTYLHSKRKYRDFILTLDVKRDRGFNYCVLFRAQLTSDTAHASLHRYQVKADHLESRSWTGGIFDDFGSRWNWLYDLSEDLRAQKAAHPPGAWDHLRIEAIDNKIKVWVNQVPTAHLINDKYKKGFIAFKIHFLGNDPDMEIAAGWIKNVRVINKQVKRFSQHIDIVARQVGE